MAYYSVVGFEIRPYVNWKSFPRLNSTNRNGRQKFGKSKGDLKTHSQNLD